MNITVTSGEDNSRLLWSCNLDGKSVGNLGAIPVELKVGAKILNAAWTVDFMILPEYRRKGIGRVLVAEANKRFDMFLAVGATNMSFGLFTRMGWKYLGDIPHYLKVWDLKPLIRKKIKNIFMAGLVFVPTVIFLAFFNFFRKPHKVKGIKVERIDRFGEEADLFWERIAYSYRMVVPRNAFFLDRKYDKQPELQYVKFRASREGDVCGYAVTRCIKGEALKPEGLITDIIVRQDDEDAIRALLSAASQYLKLQGCSLARCYFSNRHIQKIISENGFMRRKSQMHLLVSKNISGLEEIYNLDNWYLSAGDSDIDRG